MARSPSASSRTWGPHETDSLSARLSRPRASRGARLLPESRRRAGACHVVAENRRPGTDAWRLRNVAARHEIEGYAQTSVRAGERLAFDVRSDTPDYTIEIFRLGWYAGRGGRRLAGPMTLRNGAPHPVPQAGAAGLIACGWPVEYRPRHPGGLDHRGLPCEVDRHVTGDRGFFYCDFQLVRWLESQGYDVAYCTNIDIHRERRLAAASSAEPLARSRRVLVSRDDGPRGTRPRCRLAHSLSERRSCHWVIRMEEDERVVACYKRADLDPGRPVTVRFRNPEIGRPEMSLMGVQNELHCIATTSIGYAKNGEPARYRVTRPEHPLLRHTGLSFGDGFEAIGGFEWDSVYPGAPEAHVLLQCV